MRPAARLSAAIEVLGEILGHHRPAAQALADWGKAHRFAGSGDRAAIGNLVYDALRSRLSQAARMGDDRPRALALAAAAAAWGQSSEAVAGLCDGSQHAPAALSEAELAGLARDLPEATPEPVRADIPDWLWPSFTRRFGGSALAEGRALAARAPVDLRVNTLKADRERVAAALAVFHPQPTPLSPQGLRIAPAAGSGRTPNVEAEAGFQKGHFEVQDEASQVVALVAAGLARGRGQVLDLCAGAGGKTLAMAAALANKGQIHAFDSDRMRLAPIHDRLKRAGVRNVQVHPPRRESIAGLAGRMGCVVVDAPCTGTGVWRRRPESKWRLSPEALERRAEEQRRVLDEAAAYLKAAGSVLVYITCSLLPEENEDQIEACLARHAGLRPLAGADAWREAIGGEPPTAVACGPLGLVLSPALSGTDGFFLAALVRA